MWRNGAAVICVGMLLAGCDHTSGLWGNTEFDQYAQRLDTITDSAGDATRKNIVVHTDNPYSREAFDKRIPVSGSRMVKAVECLDGTRPADQTSTTSVVGVTPNGPVAGTTSIQKTDC